VMTRKVVTCTSAALGSTGLLSGGDGVRQRRADDHGILALCKLNEPRTVALNGRFQTNLGDGFNILPAPHG
jgi:hypothetical protein